MNTATLAAHGPLSVTPDVAATGAPVRKSWLSRMYDAMVEARMAQARREISYYLQTQPQNELNKRGYRFTD